MRDNKGVLGEGGPGRRREGELDGSRAVGP